MLALGLREPFGSCQLRLPVGRAAHPKVLRCLRQKAVMGAVVEGLVKAHIELGVGCGVPGLGEAVALAHQLGQDRAFQRGHAPRRVARGQHLHLRQGLEQLAQALRLQAADDEAAPMPALRQPARGQRLQGLAHRRAGHPETLRQAGLVESAAGTQGAGQDLLDQRRAHPVGVTLPVMKGLAQALLPSRLYIPSLCATALCPRWSFLYTFLLFCTHMRGIVSKRGPDRAWERRVSRPAF